ncbi:MAG: hypothetical protein ACYDA6_00145 [Solirubrobacteraceae bacterium]
MKILHGHVGSEISVRVLDENATPENPMGYEYVEGHGFYARHGDSSFAVEPNGTLYVYGDPSKPAHHSYGRHAWAWVGDENGNGAFNISLPHSIHGPEVPDGE